MIIAENDEIIPRRQSDALLEKFGEKQIEVVIIPKAGHNTLDNHNQYRAALKKFFANKRSGFGGGQNVSLTLKYEKCSKTL